MSKAVVDPLDAVLERLHEVLAEDPELLSDEQRLERERALQRVRNVTDAVEQVSIVDLERRGLPQANGASSTAIFLRGLLRLDAGEAAARVRAAQAAGPRWNLHGQRLAPRFAIVAAAQAAGTLSAAQARVIVRAVERLPDAVLDQAGDVEAELAELAQTFTARELDVLAARIHAHLDPDGALRDYEYRERHRDVAWRRRVDGSGAANAECTAELAEVLDTVFDSLAKPRPATDGAKDLRSAGQRRHDALLDALKLALRAGDLPDSGGVSATVLLTAERGDWLDGTGTTRTGHGAVVPTRLARTWAGGDARVMAVDLARPDPLTYAGASGRRVGDKIGATATATATTTAATATASTGAIGTGLAAGCAVVGMSVLQRLFTERQRLAMAVRDRGCSFPGCDRPPAWCEAHHVIPRESGGPTDVDNGTLLCGHHHRSFERAGWQCRMRDGTPEWTPPAWLDPGRTPTTNHAHV